MTHRARSTQFGMPNANTVQIQQRGVSRRTNPPAAQDTYWCHTVSVFTAFRPNRIGKYDSRYRIYCSIYWCTRHVRSGTVSVIVLGQASDRQRTGQGVLRQYRFIGCNKSLTRKTIE